MFGKAWRIGRVGGIPVNVDSSWVWIAVLVTYYLWSMFAASSKLGSSAAFAYAVGTAIMFFGSVFLHELAHAVAARLNGIEVFGITLVVFGGFTSARADQKGPGPSFVISAVGPATSLALSAGFWRLSEATSGPLAGVFGYLGWINGFMAVFNFLPGLPLDGGRMLEAILWRVLGNHDRGTRIAAYAGMGLGAVIVAIGVRSIAVGRLNDGLWPILIGIFVFQGARATERQIAVRTRMTGARVADAMDPPPPAMAADLSLSEALDRFRQGGADQAFPVIEDGGRVIGLVTFASARSIGMHDPMRPVRDALVPLEEIVTVREDEALDEVAGRLGSGRTALVLRDGRLVGTISGPSLVRWANATR